MKQSIRPFSEQGHYTEAHNLIFDYIMPRVSANAFKVLCLILRRTKGWGKKNDEISYRQIKEGSGIKTNATVSKALAELLEFGCIVRRKTEGAFDTIAYALNLKFEVPVEEIYEQVASSKNEQACSKIEQENTEFSCSKNEQGEQAPCSKNEQVASSKNEQAPSSIFEHTKAIYESSTNQNNKLDDVITGDEKNSSSPQAKELNLHDTVLNALGELVHTKMGLTSPRRQKQLEYVVGVLESKSITCKDVQVWREQLPHYLGRDPTTFTAPTLNQLLRTIEPVLEYAKQHTNGGTLSLEELKRQTAALKKKS